MVELREQDTAGGGWGQGRGIREGAEPRSGSSQWCRPQYDTHPSSPPSWMTGNLGAEDWALPC